MSYRTQCNPASCLSRDTREAIKALGISLDNYASNIEDKLRMRGEWLLAERMIEEIEASMQERKKLINFFT